MVIHGSLGLCQLFLNISGFQIACFDLSSRSPAQIYRWAPLVAFSCWQLCFSTPGYPLEFLKMLSPFRIANLTRCAMASFNSSSVASVLPWICLHQLLLSLCLLDQSEIFQDTFFSSLLASVIFFWGTVFWGICCFVSCVFPNFLLPGYFRHYTAAILDIYSRELVVGEIVGRMTDSLFAQWRN